MSRRTPHEPRSARPSVGRTSDHRVRVRWPDGTCQVLGMVAAAEFHERLGEVLWDLPVDFEPNSREDDR